MSPRVASLVLVVAVTFGVHVDAAAGSSIVPPAGQPPEVGVTPPTTAVGAMVRANLNGWTVPLVQVSICGDDAHRGSQDCDQVGSIGVTIGPTGEGSGLLRVRPPIGCPCLIRATTPDNSIVRTAPLVVRGAPQLSPSQTFPDKATATELTELATTPAPASSSAPHPSALVWVVTLVGVLGGVALTLVAVRSRRTPVDQGPRPDDQAVNFSVAAVTAATPLTTVPRSEPEEQTT
jgi:hypothetical protein